VTDYSAFPMVSIGLRQAQMGQHPKSEFPRHVIQCMRQIVKSRNQGKNGRPGIGGSQHVVNMDLIEGGFADAEHQGAPFFQTNVGRPLDQMGRVAVGDPGQSSGAAWNNDHAVSKIRAAGDIRTNVRIRLLLDFGGSLTEQSLNELVAAFDADFFGNYSKGALRSDEVDGFDPIVALDGKQEVTQKQSATGAGGSDRQILGRMVGQAGFLYSARNC
jgi:hypothetical protein